METTFKILSKYLRKSWWNFEIQRLSKNNPAVASDGKTTHCSTQPSSGPCLWSILRQWLRFHLVITFHYRVTVTSRKFELLKMYVKNEQRSAIKFCCRLKKSAVETVNRCTKRTLIRNGLKIWQSSIGIRPSPKAENCCTASPCWMTTSICTEEMPNTVTAAVWEDRHITVRQLAHALDISKSSFHTILCEKLKMWRLVAYWVPHFLIW